MKYKLIAIYTEILYHVEDFFAKIEGAINKHRGNVEEKHWKHLAPIYHRSDHES